MGERKLKLLLDCISNAEPEVHKSWVNADRDGLRPGLTLFSSSVPPYPLSCEQHQSETFPFINVLSYHIPSSHHHLS